MEIHVKESTILCPAQETPKHRLQLSDIDSIAPSNYVPSVYFYRRSSDCTNFFEVGLLRKALSKVLVPFYPAAGRLQKDGNGKIEILCNGEGVLFLEAETSCAIDDFGDFSQGSKLLPLAPTVGDTRDISSHPLFLTQVTYFKCGGVSLGTRMHHTLVDGASAYHIINSWAEMTRGVPISIQPFFDRTILGEPLNHTVERIQKTLKGMDGDYLKSALAYLKQQPDLTVVKRGGNTYKCPNLNIVDLVNMPMYDANFGWGQPIFARLVNTYYEGAVHIYRSPSNDGTLLVVINLPAHHMELFKRFFYEIFN